MFGTVHSASRERNQGRYSRHDTVRSGPDKAQSGFTDLSWNRSLETRLPYCLPGDKRCAEGERHEASLQCLPLLK